MIERILDENNIRLGAARVGVSRKGKTPGKQSLRLGENKLKRCAENDATARQYASLRRDSPARLVDVRKLLFNLADITNDRLARSGRLRTYLVPGKVPPAELERAVDGFCQVILDRWGELAADPVPLAAWAQWELDGGSLHPFARGGDRIARAFSAMLLLQGGSDLPLYDNPDSYRKHGARGIDAFVAYVRKSIERGRKWLAANPPPGPEFRVSCYCLIRDHMGRVLLVQRPADRRFPNQWELPGGKLDPGETPGQAARREAREETALVVTPLSLAGAVDHEIKGFRVIMLILESRLDGGTPQISDEHQAFRWVAPGQVLQMDLTPQLRRFFEGNNHPLGHV